MSDRNNELASSLSGYLAGYATYPRTGPQRTALEFARRRGHRTFMTAAIAAVVALVIAVPVEVTVLLRSGSLHSAAGSVAGPPYVGNLQMFTPTTGWAWGGGTATLHTDVGVQQWTVVPPPVGRLNIIEVAWVDAQSARILAASGSANLVGRDQLITWSTDDGGATWTEGQAFTALDETAQSLNAASDLDFIDQTHGWFFDTQEGTEGSPIFIFRTVDGGMHWSRVEMTPATGTAAPGALPVTCTKTGMTFVDATTGWVTGSCGGSGPFFDVTHDGGTTWSAQFINCPSQCTLNAPQFTSSLDGFLTAAVSVPYLFATTDGGRTWTQRADLPASFVLFINADDGFVLGLSGGEQLPAVVWSTNDGGRSWHAVTRTSKAQGPDSDIDAIDFVSATLGWAVPVYIGTGLFTGTPTPNTTPFTLWQTRDAGAAWNLVTPTFTRSRLPSRRGTVRGTLETVGGVAPGTPRPITGSITLRNSAGSVFTATAGSDGTFAVQVSPGIYTVTATSPFLGGGGVCDSFGGSVSVAAGATVTTVVACSIK